MISQGILPFKIEHTEEQITPRSGLAPFAEVIRAVDVSRKVQEHFPKPGSNRGYEAWSYIEPALLMLEGGGRHIEDPREIRDDEALRRLVGIGEMPSLSTYGDWLVRMGAGGGVAAIRAVNEEVAETGLCLTHEFRKGNRPAHHGAVRFLKRCLKLCRKIRRLRSDSAFYQADVLVWCEEHGIGYTIAADQDEAVQEVIKTVRDWTRLRDKDGKPTDREVGTAIHAMLSIGMQN